MNYLKKYLLFGLMLIISLLGIGINSEANEVGFSVEPIFPKNQIDAQSGYFHLLMKTGDTQKIQVKLKNTKDEKVELKTWVSSAKTNVNGVVDYSDKDGQVDPSLLYDLSQLVNIEKNIILPPKSEKIIDVDVTMPQDRMDGMIAGGLTFEEIKEGETQQIAGQTGIKNKFSYVIALLLQQDSMITQNPELSIGIVQPVQLNAKSAISADIRNVSAVFLNEMTMKVKISDKKSKKMILEYQKEGMQMAPNTTMSFPVFLNGQKLKAGEYLYEAVVSGKGASQESESQEWVLSSEFSVAHAEAQKFNKSDTQLDNKEKVSWWVWGLVGLNILLLISIAVILIVRHIKKKEKLTSLNTKRRRKKKKAEHH